MTKNKTYKTKKSMLVRYGRMGMMGWFEHNENKIDRSKKRVVIKTERGLELGDTVCDAGCKIGNLRLSREQMEKYYADSGIEFSQNRDGKFVRYASLEDLSEEKHLAKIAVEEGKYCKNLIAEMKLPMKLVHTEHLFGGERIVFYFTAESRVDFRELVRKLATEYQTKIEMRQIGSRDEAKLLGDYEICGQQCCCVSYLKILSPVNMRMAKMQKATLDPAKISGYCGRLKCCLRYEDATYNELKKRLPKKNTPVKTEAGVGTVINSQILTQLVLVQTRDGKKTAFPLEEIEILKDKPANTNNRDQKSERPRQKGQSENRKNNRGNDGRNMANNRRVNDQKGNGKAGRNDRRNKNSNRQNNQKKNDGTKPADSK